MYEARLLREYKVYIARSLAYVRVHCLLSRFCLLDIHKYTPIR